MRGQMTHPDSEVLAEFRAGLVTGRRRARIASHVAACERCAGVCHELAEVSALLAAVPAPVMPDPVALRLEAVLAAAATQRDLSERPAADRPPERAKPPRPRRGWDFRLVAVRVLAPAAAVVLLAAGGYGLSRIGASSTSSAASGSAASAAALPAASARPPTGAASGSHALPAFEAPPRFEVVISGTDYLPATLQQQLKHELAQQARAAGSAQELVPGPVKGCVLRVTASVSPVTLVLVEKAHYQGQPANVIVVARGDHDVAWVTTPACPASSHYVLDTTTLAGTSTP